MDNLKIDGSRLWESLMELARIGATEKGGVCRLALTDLDRDGRDLFVRWCEEAGCTVRVDQAGNIFARREGRDPERPPVMTGSHLDSQPTGGKFDGAYGVLAGLELVRTFNDYGYETEAPIEVVAWTNEEGSRFAPAMMASGVFGGAFDLDFVLSRTDTEGKTFGDELKRIGYAGEHPVGGFEVGAYIEAHIEQGPILEAEETTVGVVTGAQGSAGTRSRRPDRRPMPAPLRCGGDATPSSAPRAWWTRSTESVSTTSRTHAQRSACCRCPRTPGTPFPAGCSSPSTFATRWRRHSPEWTPICAKPAPR